MMLLFLLVNGRPIVFYQMIITFNIHFFFIDCVLLNELNLKHYYSDDGVDYKYSGRRLMGSLWARP
jgi:hypothetical protein